MWNTSFHFMACCVLDLQLESNIVWVQQNSIEIIRINHSILIVLTEKQQHNLTKVNEIREYSQLS